MRILLDTHIYLWFVKDDPKLSKKARDLIEQADHIFVSSASIWEMAIKMKLGKLSGALDELIDAIAQSGFEGLPIDNKHAAYVYQLSDLHRDPFDRILVAQAMSEPLRLLTADEMLSGYSELIELV